MLQNFTPDAVVASPLVFNEHLVGSETARMHV
jgi:hypothetical protein